MSSEWADATLGDYVDFKNGRTSPDRDDGASSAVFGSNGIIGYADQTNAPVNCLIIGRVGSYCGSVYHSYEKCWVTDNAILGLPKKEGESEFWYYLLMKLDLNSFRSGSGQPLLNQATLKSISVRVPKLAEERTEIGKRLMMLDKKIQLNRQTNQTLEHIAQAIFKSWFVDFEPTRAKIAAKKKWLATNEKIECSSPTCYADQFEDNNPPDIGLDETMTRAAMCAISGKNDEELDQLSPETQQQLKTTAALFPDALVASELGEMPEGWELVHLYDIATYVNGAAYKAFEPNEERRGLPIIKIAELKAGVTFQTKYSDVEMPEKYRIDSREILFSWSGNPDTSIDTFIWCNGPAWLNQHIFRVLPRNDAERAYLIAMLKSMKSIFSEIARDKQTTGLGHVTVADLKRLVVIMPSSSIISLWDAYASPILEQVFQSELEINTLNNIRNMLLPKLLAGEFSIGVTQTTAPATTILKSAVGRLQS